MDRTLSTRAFDTAYGGTPTWETGRPQPTVLALLEAGWFGPRVLDVGCGTGLHAVVLAERGHAVVAIDVAARAVEQARARAAAAGVVARFVHGDVLDLPALGTALGAPFDSVLDAGLFHVLQPADRASYAVGLASVVRPGGTGAVVAWSDRNPFGRGPSRVRRRDLRDAFRVATGWRVESIEPGILESRLEPGRVEAWVARLRRR
jgi:2-polyprenyl-3-methyl-5-hydroxy-6-metoxy-1,4-benzoquinol methylase